MSTIKSDAQGFLIGDVLDVSKALLKGQEEGLNTLARMDANLAALVRQRRNGGGRRFNDLNAPAPDAIAGLAPPVIAEPAGRAAVRVASAARKVAAAATAVEASMGAASPAVSARDARGRFIKRGTGGASGVGAGEANQQGGGERRTPAERGKGNDEDSRIAKIVKTAVAESTDKVDPYIEATKEIFEPIGRTWGVLADKSKERKKEGWYKRILQALKERTVQVTGGAATAVGGMGGGLLSQFGGTMLKGAGGLFSGVAKGGMALLKRAPLIGAAVSAGEALYEAFKDDDPTKSKEENRQDRYARTGRAVGAGTGAVLGGALGSFLGPAGTVGGSLAGYKLGGYLGEKGGLFTKDLVDTGAPGRAYDAVARRVGVARDMVVAGAGRVAGSVGSVVDSAGGALGQLIGRHEGDYGSFNRGKAGDSRGQRMDFGNMTVGEVMALQSLPATDPRRLFAVGKYQVIPKTMSDAVKSLGIDKEAKLSPDLQERIFSDYLVGKKRPAVADFRAGRSNDIDAAVDALSKEFASVQNPYTGRGYYDGQAGNRASLSVDAVRSALMTDRATAVASTGLLSVPSIRNMSALTIPPTPAVAAIPGLTDKDGWRSGAFALDTVGQDVGDRSIAHIITGGLGTTIK